jgi:hypothetical protein
MRKPFALASIISITSGPWPAPSELIILFFHIAKEGLPFLSIPFYQPDQKVFPAIFTQLIPFSQQQGMMDAGPGNRLLSCPLTSACFGQECLDF